MSAQPAPAREPRRRRPRARSTMLRAAPARQRPWVQTEACDAATMRAVAETDDRFGEE